MSLKDAEAVAGAISLHRRHLRQIGDEDNTAILAEEEERQQELEEEEADWEGGTSKLTSSRSNGNLVKLYTIHYWKTCRQKACRVPIQRCIVTCVDRYSWPIVCLIYLCNNRICLARFSSFTLTCIHKDKVICSGGGNSVVPTPSSGEGFQDVSF